VTYDSKVDPSDYLGKCGATEDECDFLVQDGWPRHWAGERVELNAMTSPQFIEWLEQKLAEVGVQKVVPQEDVLAQAYRRAQCIEAVQQAVDEAVQQAVDEAVQAAQSDEAVMPADLREQVGAKLAAEPARSWDEVVAELVREAV
jgi:hypothetical protein